MISQLQNVMDNDLKSEYMPKIRAVFDRYSDSLAAAYLFGSAAKGEMTPLSDIDIAILFTAHTQQRTSTLRFRLYADLSRVLQRNDIDLVVLNSSSNLMLQDDIIRSGVLIYEGDADTREAFESRILHMGIDFRQQRRMVMGA